MIVTLLPVLALAAQPAAEFDARFTGRTLRFDYHHAGDAREEHVALDGLRLEGDWPGSRTQLVDTTNLGKYLFEVVDPATQQVVWSRGFASIYGEWETTGEAKRAWRVFEESQRFPEPRLPAQLVLKKRQGDGTFREIFAQLVDPAERFTDRSPLAGDARVTVLHEGDHPSVALDILVVADGYTAAEADKFEADVRRLSGALLDTEPFRSRRGDLSLRALHVASPASGISDPRRGQWRGNALGCSYNAFDSDRYVLTYRNRELREAAAQAPYDALIILFNGRKYGGGGIFNLWATCASDSSESPYVFVHEFGHSFGGLADEYYSSQVSYEDFVAPGTEPWEPNVTALLDPARLKWADLVEPGTPLPTPWGKEAYDARDLEYQKRRAEIARAGDDAAAEALMADVKRATRPMLEGDPNFGRVGAFEGASYEPKGLYRPEVDCIMFTRNPTTFCRVCARAIGRAIDLHAR
ncbi:MAG: peptidase M64 [Planctomycetes bacterium]|nr:peptidase M64 [Planctomycetota bacterium]